jgi:hypothetical protein
MNRADRLEAALRQIADTHVRYYVDAQAIARRALDFDYPRAGEPSYNAVEDQKLAHEWMAKHERADELIFVKGRPYMAVYYEPVAEHYQQARQRFREFCEAFRQAREEYWWPE